jgi:dTDP-4-amino-4,6-dideoxygalactose transaminase
VRAEALIRKALPIVRRRARWLVRRPAVRGPVSRPLPGGLRLGEAEEEAAVEAVREVIRSRRLFRYGGMSGSPFEKSQVRRLERSFAATIGTEHALAVNSGTSALVCGLAGMGIGPEDEVIVPAYTWFSTATAVMAVGAVPVIAEVDDSLTLDPEDARQRVTPRTRALVAVHMRGAPAAMDRLTALAAEHDLRLLEDVAQAAGASFGGRRLGSLGDAGAFSFHMAKVITSGEGGMLVTDDPALHRRAAMYHDSAAPVHLGLSPEEWLPGLNLRMSELQAAVAGVQLERLDGLLADMRERKTRIKDLIGDRLRERGAAFRTLHDPQGEAGLALIFFLADAERTEPVVSALADENVPASRLYHGGARSPGDYVDFHAYPYWAPLLRRRTWSEAGGPWRWHPEPVEYPPDACPVTVDLLRRAVHIDVTPDLTALQVEQMADAIVDTVRRLG